MDECKPLPPKVGYILTSLRWRSSKTLLACRVGSRTRPRQRPLARGSHSFPFPINLSSLFPSPLNLSLLCPPITRGCGPNRFGSGMFYYNSSSGVQVVQKSGEMQLDATTAKLAEGQLTAGCVTTSGNLMAACNLVCFDLVTGLLSDPTGQSARNVLVHHISVATIATDNQSSNDKKFGSKHRRMLLETMPPVREGDDGETDRHRAADNLAAALRQRAGTAAAAFEVQLRGVMVSSWVARHGSEPPSEACNHDSCRELVEIAKDAVHKDAVHRALVAHLRSASFRMQMSGSRNQAPRLRLWDVPQDSFTQGTPLEVTLTVPATLMTASTVCTAVVSPKWVVYPASKGIAHVVLRLPDELNANPDRALTFVRGFLAAGLIDGFLSMGG